MVASLWRVGTPSSRPACTVGANAVQAKIKRILVIVFIDLVSGEKPAYQVRKHKPGSNSFVVLRPALACRATLD